MRGNTQTPTAIRSREYRARKKAGRVLPRQRRLRSGLAVTGNTATAEAYGRITTLEQLIEVCKIDLKVWKVDRFEVNKWEMGAKDEFKNLSYRAGKVSGEISGGGIIVEPLFQVKAWLTRLEPEPVRPVIKPIVVHISHRKRGLRPDVDDHRWLVLPDPQIGFRKSLRTGLLEPHHDRRAMDIAVQAAAMAQVEGVVFIGDMLDLADWSEKFLRTPNLMFTTQPSLLEAAWWMGRFRDWLPDAKMVLIEGNHERRLHDAIVKDMPEAYGLRAVDHMDDPPALSVPNLLGLKSLGVEWRGDYPDGFFEITPGLVVEHGDMARAKSGATAAAMVEGVTDETRIIGHIHRIECAYKTTWMASGPCISAVWSFGCLSRIDGEVPGTSRRQNWQQGMGLIEVYEPGVFHITPIRINDGRACFYGQEYEGIDRTVDLRRDTGWAF